MVLVEVEIEGASASTAMERSALRMSAARRTAQSAHDASCSSARAAPPGRCTSTTPSVSSTAIESVEGTAKTSAPEPMCGDADADAAADADAGGADQQSDAALHTSSSSAFGSTSK